MNNKVHVKKGDTVKVISGRDKNKTGKVLAVEPAKQLLIVEGVSVNTRHVRPRKQGQQGGLIKQEGHIRACKVMLVCPKCKQPTRVAHTLVGDSKFRTCKKCGETEI